MRRLATLLILAAASLAAPARAQMSVGSNVSDIGAYVDLWEGSEVPDWPNFQAATTADRKPGGTFRLANPGVVDRSQAFDGMRVESSLRIPTTAGPVVVAGWIVAGLDEFHPVRFSPASADVAYPKGTIVDRTTWNNQSTVPADWPLAPAKGGWPAGLKPGQGSGYLSLQGPLRLAKGDYDFLATGSGKWAFFVRYRDGTPQSTQTITFAKGKADRPLTLASSECWGIQPYLLESDPKDPVLPRALLPRAMTAAFLARPPDAGPMLAPEALANERAARWVRFMDLQRTNDDDATDWTPAAEALHRRLLARANASGANPWLCVPRRASDAYVASQAKLVESLLAPGLRWAQEYGNEGWNGSFNIHGYLRRYGAAEFSPLRKDAQPLAEVPDGVGAAIDAAKWDQLDADGSRIEFTTPAPHGIGGEDIVLISGYDDPALNGVFRADAYQNSPNVFAVTYSVQGGSIPLPKGTGPYEGKGRFVKLAGWTRTAAHEMGLLECVQRGQGRRAAQVYRIAREISPRVVPEVGGWSGSDDSLLLDQFIADTKDAPAPIEPAGYATAPYAGPDDIRATDRSLVGEMIQVGSSVLKDGVVTCRGPFPIAGGSTLTNHGLASGPATIVNAPLAAWSGPTTITVTGTDSFTFPVKPDLATTPVTPASGYIGMQVIPGPPANREILSVAREGDVLRFVSPAHGLKVGDRIGVGGIDLRGTSLDGPATVASVQADSFTILRPGYTPAEPGRAWAWLAATLDRLIATMDDHIATTFGRNVRLAARLADDRGMAFDCYEFALAYGCSDWYRYREPANLIHQAAQRDPRAKAQLARCLLGLYAAGCRRVLYYGDSNAMGNFGTWAPEEWRGQGGPRREAIDEARALFGLPPSVWPRSTTAGRPVPIAITPAPASKAAPRVVGGDGASLSGGVLDPGKLPGLLGIAVGDATIPFVVDPPVALAFAATPATVPAGKPRAFKLSGENARWSKDTKFTISGGRARVAGVRVVAKRLAEIDLDPGIDPATLTISDGEGGTATIKVRPSEPGTVDGVDDPDYAEIGAWNDWGNGYGGSMRWRRADQPGPASASWKYTAPASGRYRVSATWGAGSTHPPRAKYAISVAGKDVAYRVADQRVDANDFAALGEVDAKAGQAIVLTLDPLDTGGDATADAARFELISPAAEPGTKPDPPQPTEIDLLKARLDILEARQRDLDVFLGKLRSALPPEAPK